LDIIIIIIIIIINLQAPIYFCNLHVSVFKRILYALVNITIVGVGLDHLATLPASPVNGSVLAQIGCVHVGAMLNEHPRDVQVPIGTRNAQRCISVAAQTVHGHGLQKTSHFPRTSFGAGFVKGLVRPETRHFATN
jgi:hypothetical protein